MADILELIKTRRSVRKFQDKSVPKELIDKVIEAGLFAASGKNMQPSVVIAITNKDLREQITKINAHIMGSDNVDSFYGAPVFLLVIAKADNKNSVYDGTLTLGNMMLEAHALGLGSCWINRAREGVEQYDLYKDLIKSLALNDDYIGIGHLALGYPVDNEPKIIPRKENRSFYID